MDYETRGIVELRCGSNQKRRLTRSTGLYGNRTRWFLKQDITKVMFIVLHQINRGQKLGVKVL